MPPPKRAKVVFFPVNGCPTGNALGSPPNVPPQTTTWITPQEAHDAAEAFRLELLAAGAAWATLLYDQPEGEGSAVPISTRPIPEGVVVPSGAIIIEQGDGIYWFGPVEAASQDES